MRLDQEPLRLKGWLAIAAGAALVFVVGITTMGLDWQQAVGVVALQLLTTIPGLEWARGTFARDGEAATWSPESVRAVAVGAVPPPEPRELPPEERGDTIDVEPGTLLDDDEVAYGYDTEPAGHGHDDHGHA